MVSGPPKYEWAVSPSRQKPQLLSVERIKDHYYKSIVSSHWVPKTGRGICGGQLLGLAVSSAVLTSPSGLELANLHCTFYNPADSSKALEMRTELTDKRSRTARVTVNATQGSQLVLTMFLVFRREDLSLPTFHHPILKRLVGKALLKPEEAPLVQQRLSTSIEQGHCPAEDIERAKEYIWDREESLIEIRDAYADMYSNDGRPLTMHEQAFWVRQNDATEFECDKKALLACISDMYILGTVARSMGASNEIGFLASLDHSMYFYAPFERADWLLFHMECQAAGHGRGVTTARIHRQDGAVVAVVIQEGKLLLEKGHSQSRL